MKTPHRSNSPTLSLVFALTFALVATAAGAQDDPSNAGTAGTPALPSREAAGAGGPVFHPPLEPPPLVLSRGIDVESLDAPPVHTEEVMKLKDRLPSGRDRVAVDVFRPPEPGKYPAVIILHGTHGPGRAEKYYLGLSEDLARHRYVALFVRYYDRGRKGRGNRALWAKTIGDTLTFAGTLPDVDPDRLALMGYSQGAFLALNDAPSDPRIRAVVAYYGGLSPGFVPVAQEYMPPTLLFHGTADRIVPIRRSMETLEALRKAGQPSDLVVYVGAGHGFNLNSKQGPNAIAAQDSWQRTLAFLDFHLRYPAWTPAVLPLDPPQSAGPQGPSPQGTDSKPYFATPPLTVVPYLALSESPSDGNGRPVILVNPTPEQIAKVAPPVHHKKSHRKPAKGTKAPAAPKAPPPAPKGDEIMP